MTKPEAAEDVDGQELSDQESQSRAKTDSRSEVQKLFEKLKTGSRHDATLAHQTTATPEDRGDRHPPPSHSPLASLASENFLQMTQAVLRDVGAGRQLLEFCLALPVFKSLAEEKGNFLAVEGGTDPTAVLASAVKRYM